MKDFLQGLWGIVVLAGLAMSMGWIDVPKPIMAMVERANGKSQDAFSALKTRMPENQSLLIGVAELAREKYLAETNDLAKGSARVSRKEELCAVIGKSTDRIWFGVIDNLSTNSDGLGVLSIRIAPHITLSTWNNSLSDFRSGTLISPASSIYKTAARLAEGDRVRFTGEFIASDVDCISEQSVTLDGSLTDPEFTMRFTSLSAD